MKPDVQGCLINRLGLQRFFRRATHEVLVANIWRFQRSVAANEMAGSRPESRRSGQTSLYSGYALNRSGDQNQMSALRKAREPGPAILVRLNEDHQHLAQVLEAFERQYRALQTDEGPDYELLRDILDYVQSFPDTVHHPTEDALFDYLLRNAWLSAGEQTVIRDNRAQHEKLINATQDLLRMIDQAFYDGIIDRSELTLTMSKYLAEQRRHMEFETGCLFPLAETRLSQRDREELKNQLQQTKDPLFDAYDEQYEILRRLIETQHASAVRRSVDSFMAARTHSRVRDVRGTKAGLKSAVSMSIET